MQPSENINNQLRSGPWQSGNPSNWSWAPPGWPPAPGQNFPFYQPWGFYQQWPNPYQWMQQSQPTPVSNQGGVERTKNPSLSSAGEGSSSHGHIPDNGIRQ